MYVCINLPLLLLIERRIKLLVFGFAPFLSYINLLLLILWMKIIFLFVCNLSEKLKLLVFGFLHFAAELFCELRREEKR